MLFQRWLEQRGISDCVMKEPDQRGCLVFKINDLDEKHRTWETAWHGTRWYALWQIIAAGQLLESNNEGAGHDFWCPGVYCTPEYETGRWYARPHILFGDGVYHRAFLELRVDMSRVRRIREKGGKQMVFPGDAVIIRAVWIDVNAPPDRVDCERFLTWDASLEAVPAGSHFPAPIINDKTPEEWRKVGSRVKWVDGKVGDDETEISNYEMVKKREDFFARRRAAQAEKEAESRRAAEEEQRKKAAAEERARAAQAEEARRAAEEERRKKAAAEERARAAQAEQARRAAEDEQRKKAAAEERVRAAQAEKEAEARRAAEEEQRKKAAAEERARATQAEKEANARRAAGRAADEERRRGFPWSVLGGGGTPAVDERKRSSEHRSGSSNSSRKKPHLGGLSTGEGAWRLVPYAGGLYLRVEACSFSG
jgi:hypothetical protein